MKSGEAPSGALSNKLEQASNAGRHHRIHKFAVSILQQLREASVQLAALRSSSSSSSSQKEKSSSKKGSSSRQSSSSSRPAQAAPTYAAPALLQLAGASLIIIAQALAGVLQVGDLQQQEQQQQAQGTPCIAVGLLADHLFQCLEHVTLFGSQLQQLELPGKKKLAAAALQDLQEQQQQLQQALTAALWRLGRVCDSAQAHDQQVERHLAASSSSSSSNVCAVLQHHIAQWHAEAEQLASQNPPEAFTAAATAGDVHLQEDCDYGFLPAELTAQLLGARLSQQLQGFGSSLWSALPQRRCCNNAACTNLGSVSEAKLVSAKGSRCSKCQVAR
jgi:hypothetical protein